jgi:2'-5' RNA ligase
MERIFVALMLGEDLARTLHGEVLRALAPTGDGPPPGWIRLYAPGDIHMTLSFLGTTESSALSPLRDFLRDGLRSLGALPACHLRIDHTGCFPRRGQERVLWAGVHEEGVEGVSTLERIERIARSALSFSSSPREETRPFAPHLTLARVRTERMPRGAGIPAAFYGLRPDLDWTPRELSIVRSLPGPARRLAYEVVHALDLHALHGS